MSIHVSSLENVGNKLQANAGMNIIFWAEVINQPQVPLVTESTQHLQLLWVYKRHDLLVLLFTVSTKERNLHPQCVQVEENCIKCNIM